MAIDWEATLSSWEKVTSIAQNIVTVIAIFIGAIWTYYTFIKGRTLTPRLELKILPRIFKSGNLKYLVATIQLKNAGSSKVDIVQKGSLLGVYTYEPKQNKDSPESVEWVQYRASSVLANHHWIEPGEIVEEPVLIPIVENDSTIYKVLFRINSRQTTWMVESIIEGSIKERRA